MRLETGLKLARLLGSRLGFLSNGVITAVLNVVGKQPSLKERFASLAINSEKTEGQALRRAVGMKSMLEDLHGMK
jgi:hypothetical protein